LYVDASESKNPHDLAVMGIQLVLGCGGRVGQRRYLSEKARSRLRGNKVCLITIAPALLVRVLAEPGLAFLLDHCQVGLAVMSIIGEFSFFCVGVKKPEDMYRVSGFGRVRP
jgi:hypothetical protein